MSVSRRGYYSPREEHSHGVIDKISGLAKMAGIAAVGLVATRPLLSRLGRWTAETLPGKVRIGDSLEQAGRSIFSRTYNLFAHGVQDIRRAAVSSVIHAQRMEAFLGAEVGGGGLRAHFLGSDQEWAPIRKALAEKLTPFTRAIDSKAASESFYRTDTFGEINQILDRHQFAWGDDLAQRRRSIDRLVRESASSRVASPKLYMEKEANRVRIVEAIKEAAINDEKRSKAIGRFFNLGKEITIEDIEKDPALARSVEKYLENIGIKPRENGITRTEEFINSAYKSIDYVFSDIQDGKQVVYKEADLLKEALRKSGTGLVHTKDGQVVSTAFLRHYRETVTTRALNELQIPLLPGVFNVPVAGLFKFARSAPNIITNVGRLEGAPELARMGIQFGSNTEGVMVGRKLLSFNPNSSEINMISGQFKAVPMTGGLHRLDLARREAGPNIYHDLMDETKRDGWIKGLITAVRKSDPQAVSKLNEYLHGAAEHYIDINYDMNRGFHVTAKDKASHLGLDTLALRKLYGGATNVQPHQIHPKQLWDFVTQNYERMDPDHLRDALNHIFSEGSNSQSSIGSSLKTIAKAIKSGEIRADTSASHWNHLLEMAENADDPNALLGAMFDPSHGGGKNIFDMYSEMSTSATSDFFQAVTSVGNDPESVFGSGVGDGGLINNLKKGFKGSSDPSRRLLNLQRGMLTEIVNRVNIEELNSYGGREEIVNLITTLANGGEVSESKLYQQLESVGFNEVSLKRVLTDMTTTKDSQIVLKENLLGTLGSPFSSAGKLLSYSKDPNTATKILNELRQSLDVVSSYTGDPRRANKMLMEMADQANLSETLIERFKLGRQPFRPLEQTVSANDHYLVPNSAPSFWDILEDPGGSAQDLLSRSGGGLVKYFSSLVNPSDPMGSAALFTSILVQMPQEIGNLVGLGLPRADMVTAARSILGFTMRRVLPVYVGWEGYKNYNANMHSLGLPGIDDMGANILANVNLLSAKAKDTLGITGGVKKLVGALPGLDQYVHPRSNEEYENYLAYGNEGVRKGRYWVIGSRQHFGGDAVQYFRPNFYRRWKSHWTEASNVDISNPYHSWLPNLQNPLGGITRLANPNWWVNKHMEDRPYVQNGNVFDPFTLPGAMINPITNIFHNLGSAKPERGGTWVGVNYSGSWGGTIGGGLALGKFGGGIPASMTYDRPDVGYGGGHGGHGGGHGGGYGGEGGDFGPARISYNKDMVVEGGHGIYNSIAGFIDSARTQAGLYGAFMQMLPIYPKHNYAYGPQDPSIPTSFSRSMWMGDRGELLGPLGEFFRRFIQKPSQSYDAYSPYKNNQPSWIVAANRRFGTGDPYMRVPGIGELELPGDAYERTHPWAKPLKVRGSSVGATEEELIQKWLFPNRPLEGDDAEDFVGFGNVVHKEIQRNLNSMGVLAGAEVSIYDREHNISGTVDAMVRGPNGLEIIEIKTQGAKNWGMTPEKYKDQLNFYLGTTGLKLGHFVFVNRDNPDQIRTETVEFDQKRWNETMARIERARDTMKDYVHQGMISPFETYDVLSRIEILSHVAPQSPEFRDLVKYAEESGGFGGFEKQRFEQAKEEARILNEDYNIYPRINGVDLETRKLELLGVGEDGSLLTSMGTLSLAGVKWDQQAFAYKDAREVYEEFGLYVGDNISVTLQEGQFNPDTMADRTTPAIIGTVNKKVLKAGYGEANSDRGALAARVQGRTSLIGHLWEHLAHSDNLLCVHPRTEVRTEKGLKYAIDVQIGDRVLGSDGEYHKVDGRKVGQSPFRILEVYLKGSNKPIILTENHKVRYLSAERSKSIWSRGPGERLGPLGRKSPTINEGEIGTLKDYDYLVYTPANICESSRYKDFLNYSDRFTAIEKELYSIGYRGSKIKVGPRFFDMTPDFARLLGYFAAEGSIGENKTGRAQVVIFSLDQKEEEYTQDIQKILRDLNLYATIKDIPGTEARAVIVSSCWLAELLNKTIGTCHEKQVPWELLGDLELASEFVRGVMRGDGPKTHYPYHNLTLRALNLCVGVRDLISRVFNIPSTISNVTNNNVFKGFCINIGYIPDFHKFIDEYGYREVDTSLLDNEQWQRLVLDNGDIAIQIRSINEVSFTGDVVDLSVEDNHHFTLVNATVHNSNKFMRVRTALEQFERGEVFGTDKSRWDDLYGNYVEPTISSFVAKSPIVAGIQSGFVASLFIRGAQEKLLVGKIAAAVGASLSMIRVLKEGFTGETWTPSRYRKQNEFDEYWDVLNYLKQTAIAEGAKKQARRKEGVDIDQLEKSPSRVDAELGPWAMIAIDAERKAKRTMYAYDETISSLQDAIYSLPRRQRQIATSIIETGTPAEKSRFFNLLGDPQKRVLGKYLGVDAARIPKRANLEDYFSKHFLPDVDWAGWNRGVDMGDLRTRSANLEGVKIDKPNRDRVEMAQGYTRDVIIPRMDHPTVRNIKSSIRALLIGGGFENISPQFSLHPSDKNVIDIHMDLYQDDSSEIIRHMNEDIKRG